MVGLGQLEFVRREITVDELYWEPMEKIKKWCAKPYPDHPKGCPNLPDCKHFKRGRDQQILNATKLHLVVAVFDLETYAKKMKKRFEFHPVAEKIDSMLNALESRKQEAGPDGQ